MHREIMGVNDSKIHIDHWNHNGLDNRKGNLRICNHAQNAHNRQKKFKTTSQYKGVYWSHNHDKWLAYIQTPDKRRKYLGSFDLEKDAAQAYNEAALVNFGEFANINVPI